MKLAPCYPEGNLHRLPSPSGNSRGWPWSVQSPPFVNRVRAHLPIIAVVMPSFNQGSFIEEAIRSVLLQNYPRLFFAVIDGGSSDHSIDVIDKYKPWLSYVRVGPDDGQAAAINEGFNAFISSFHASKSLLGWLNSDDIYLLGALQKVASTYQHKKSDVIYGDSLRMNCDGSQVDYHLNPVVRTRFLRDGGILASHATFWNSSIHQPLDERYACALDYELWLRLIPKSKLSYIPYPLGAIRIHSDAKSHSENWVMSWEDDASLNGMQYTWLYDRNPWLDLDKKISGALHRFISKRRVERALNAIKADSERWI